MKGTARTQKRPGVTDSELASRSRSCSSDVVALDIRESSHASQCASPRIHRSGTDLHRIFMGTHSKFLVVRRSMNESVRGARLWSLL